MPPLPQRHARLDGLAMALLTVLCLTWGLQQIAVKVAAIGISPVLQAGIRSIGAGLLLWLWSAFRGIALFERDGSLVPGLVLGIVFAAEVVVLFWGLSVTTASRAVVVLYTAPFFVAIGAHLLLPDERLRPINFVGLVCAFTGIAVAFADGLAGQGGGSLLGDLAVLSSAVGWAATTLIVKATGLIRVSPNKTLFYQLAVSGVSLPLVSWIMGEPGFTDPTPLMLACLAYQVILVAFVSYLAWFWLMIRYPAAKLAAFTFVTPLFGLIAGGILLNERITPALVAALALVAIGIQLVNRRGKPAPTKVIGAVDA
ncbi:MAG TPA: DMT family transporter [Stellaceae bacterium]|nr:DMT family transporter [Stellaceae bacterium]